MLNSEDYTDQNLNSGSLLTNGLNSWLAMVGSPGPSSVCEGNILSLHTMTLRPGHNLYLCPPPRAGPGQTLE